MDMNPKYTLKDLTKGKDIFYPFVIIQEKENTSFANCTWEIWMLSTTKTKLPPILSHIHGPPVSPPSHSNPRFRLFFNKDKQPSIQHLHLMPNPFLCICLYPKSHSWPHHRYFHNLSLVFIIQNEYVNILRIIRCTYISFQKQLN